MGGCFSIFIKIFLFIKRAVKNNSSLDKKDFYEYAEFTLNAISRIPPVQKFKEQLKKTVLSLLKNNGQECT